MFPIKSENYEYDLRVSEKESQTAPNHSPADTPCVISSKRSESRDLPSPISRSVQMPPISKFSGKKSAPKTSNLRTLSARRSTPMVPPKCPLSLIWAIPPWRMCHPPSLEGRWRLHRPLGPSCRRVSDGIFAGQNLF